MQVAKGREAREALQRWAGGALLTQP